MPALGLGAFRVWGFRFEGVGCSDYGSEGSKALRVKEVWFRGCRFRAPGLIHLGLKVP